MIRGTLLLLGLLVGFAATSVAASVGLTYLEDAKQIEPWLIQTRRLFHRHPELMFEVCVPSLHSSHYHTLHTHFFQKTVTAPYQKISTTTTGT